MIEFVFRDTIIMHDENNVTEPDFQTLSIKCRGLERNGPAPVNQRERK